LSYLLQIGAREARLEDSLYSTKGRLGLDEAACRIGEAGAGVSKAAVVGNLLSDFLRIGACKARLEDRLHIAESRLGLAEAIVDVAAEAHAGGHYGIAIAKAAIAGNLLSHLLRIGACEARLEDCLHIAESWLRLPKAIVDSVGSEAGGVHIGNANIAVAEPAVTRDLLTDFLRIGARKARLENGLNAADSWLGLTQTDAACRISEAGAGVGKSAVSRDLLTDLLRIGACKARLEDRLYIAERRLGLTVAIGGANVVQTYRIHCADVAQTCRIDRAVAEAAVAGNLLSHLLRIGPREARLEDGLHVSKCRLGLANAIGGADVAETYRIHCADIAQASCIHRADACSAVAKAAVTGDLLSDLLRVGPCETRLEYRLCIGCKACKLIGHVIRLPRNNVPQYPAFIHVDGGIKHFFAGKLSVPDLFARPGIHIASGEITVRHIQIAAQAAQDRCQLIMIRPVRFGDLLHLGVGFRQEIQRMTRIRLLLTGRTGHRHVVPLLQFLLTHRRKLLPDLLKELAQMPRKLASQLLELIDNP